MSRALDFGHLVELCRRAHEETRRSAARAADTFLVTRNWLFGWYIVEYEQRGVDRAKYGSRLLAKVSRQLQEAGIKGCSTSRLKLYRQFYQQHRGIKAIGPTLPDQFVSFHPGSQERRDPIAVQRTGSQYAGHYCGCSGRRPYITEESVMRHSRGPSRLQENRQTPSVESLPTRHGFGRHGTTERIAGAFRRLSRNRSAGV